MYISIKSTVLIIIYQNCILY